MNPQNDPARIRAKKALKELFKSIALSTEIILKPVAYDHIDSICDDLIQAAVNQMQAEKLAELAQIVDPDPIDQTETGK